jgi:hypothetical protein
MRLRWNCQRQGKDWRDKARDHKSKSDWYWKQSKSYEGKDWHKVKYYKNKAHDHGKHA